MDYRKKILDCLVRLEKLYDNDGSTAALQQRALTEQDPRKLFGMYQTLREEIAKVTGEDASFTICLPNGQLYKAKSLADAQEAVRRTHDKSKQQAHVARS